MQTGTSSPDYEIVIREIERLKAQGVPYQQALYNVEDCAYWAHKPEYGPFRDSDRLMLLTSTVPQIDRDWDIKAYFETPARPQPGKLPAGLREAGGVRVAGFWTRAWQRRRQRLSSRRRRAKAEAAVLKARPAASERAARPWLFALRMPRNIGRSLASAWEHFKS